MSAAGGNYTKGMSPLGGCIYCGGNPEHKTSCPYVAFYSAPADETGAPVHVSLFVTHAITASWTPRMGDDDDDDWSDEGSEDCGETTEDDILATVRDIARGG